MMTQAIIVATGWLMTSRMQPELRQKQRSMTAMAVSILEDTHGDEPHAGRESVRNPATRLRAASALGAAAMIGESVHGLYVMHVGFVGSHLLMTARCLLGYRAIALSGMQPT